MCKLLCRHSSKVLSNTPCTILCLCPATVYRDQVIERIEQLAAELVAAAAAGQLPQLSCVSTAASNVHMAQQYAAAARRRPAAADSTDAYQATGSAAAYGLAGSALQFGSGMGDEDFDEAAAGVGLSQGVWAQQQQQQQQQGDEGDEAEDAGWDDEDGAAAAGRQHVLRLGSRMQTRTLLGSAGAQAHGIVRGEHLACCCAALFCKRWQAFGCL
jgi:hypothetical protein